MQPTIEMELSEAGAVLVYTAQKGMTMNKESIEGATQKGVGAVKEATGKATGNEKLQAEGMADKVAGSAKEAVGKTKETIHDATK